MGYFIFNDDDGMGDSFSDMLFWLIGRIFLIGIGLAIVGAVIYYALVGVDMVFGTGVAEGFRDWAMGLVDSVGGG